MNGSSSILAQTWDHEYGM